MELIVVRHGEIDTNVLQLCESRIKNSPTLNQRGLEQAKQVANKLKNKKFDIIYTSQLLRTKQTAKEINKFHNLKIKEDKRINDRIVGDFQGKSVKEFHDFMFSKDDPWNNKQKGMESFEEEKNKIFEFLNELKKENYENVLIVTHMETIQIFNIYFNNISNEKAWNIQINNCDFFEFRYK